MLFALYIAGVGGAVLAALVTRRASRRSSCHPLLMELPEYHWPNLRNLVTGLWARTQICLTLGSGLQSVFKPLGFNWQISVLAAALSLLAWYVYAPQCLSTLVTVRRETNSWR